MAIAGERPWIDETARAFDRVAGEYDATNAANPILAHMRARAVAVLRRHVPAGADVLDVGCGPGTDHPALVAAGYCVTGIDISAEMVRQARLRASQATGPHRPTILCRSVEQLAKFQPGLFDAAFSNFGPLNCVPDLGEAAARLHDVLRPRGVLVASVIGRVCPWEVALFLARGQVRRALVRYRRGIVGVPLKRGTVWTRYLTPGEFTHAFTAGGFARCELSGMGVIAPPPYLEHLAARRPALVDRLLRLDDVAGGWPILRQMGDHFLIVLRRD